MLEKEKIMLYRQKFEKFLWKNAPNMCGELTNSKGICDYVQSMYFEKPKGCIPINYLGEDLMNDIQTKFYFPLSFLRVLFLKKHSGFKEDGVLITIDPSYEDFTNYNITLKEQRIVLLQNQYKAWNFWFEDENEFDNWINSCLNEMEDGLKKIKY
jgi:hypothetical protein